MLDIIVIIFLKFYFGQFCFVDKIKFDHQNPLFKLIVEIEVVTNLNRA